MATAEDESQPCLKEEGEDRTIVNADGVTDVTEDNDEDVKKESGGNHDDDDGTKEGEERHSRREKENGGVSKDDLHSNGVKSERGGGEGGGDGVRQRHVTKQATDDITPVMSPEELEQFIPDPPDGGWGWVIVFASFCNNLIVDGLCYTYGVFLIEFVDQFKVSSTKVSLVGSLLCGVYLLSGPIVSAMTNKFGCRAVVIAGSIVSTLAFLLATRAQSIDVLILTYGLMGGFGLGMIYLPSIVSVGYYFSSKRAFATGLAVAGSGLGTFIFPPMCDVLLVNFSWRGALLIVAGINFNACVSGSLMRPLNAKPPKAVTNGNHQPRNKGMWDRVQQYFHRNRAQSESLGDDITAKVSQAKQQREKRLQETDSVLGSVPSVAFNRLDSTSTEDGKFLAAYKKTSGSSVSSQPESPKITFELENVNGVKILEDVFVLDGPRSHDARDGKDEGKSSIHNKPPHHTPRHSELSSLLAVPGSGGGAGAILPPGCGGSRSNLYHLSSMRSLHVSKKDLAKDLARPLYRKDIFYSASVLNISQYQSQQDVKSYIASITTLPGERDFLDGTTASSNCINSSCSCLPRSARDVLSEMVDVSLFKDISFMLICLGNFLAFLGFFIPFMFMVDKAVDAGIGKTDATFLISIIGITNTVGRIAVGKIVDHKILDSLVVSYSAITLCGIMVAVTPFCNVYGLLALNAALFGTGMAAFVSLSSILICDRMGVEKLTNAFGLMSMTRGVSGIVGPPLAGQLFEMTKNYNLSFYMAGFFFIAGAVCHMFLHLPCLRPKREDMREFTMEEIDPEEVGLTSLSMGGKEQPTVLTVEEISDQ